MTNTLQTVIKGSFQDMKSGGEIFFKGAKTSEYFPEDVDLMQIVTPGVWEGDVVERVVVYDQGVNSLVAKF